MSGTLPWKGRIGAYDGKVSASARKNWWSSVDDRFTNPIAVRRLRVTPWRCMGAESGPRWSWPGRTR